MGTASKKSARAMPSRRGVELGLESLSVLASALKELQKGFAGLPPPDTQISGEDRVQQVLLAVADRLKDNYPYFHPLYAGQMLKPPHPVARLAYALAMHLNPNNHALDGGRASSAMEKEAIAELAKMFGWTEFLGHLCGGGTMANLEALWVAGQLHSGKKILASEQAHYTHKRISGVLQLPFEPVPCDARGRMDSQALAERAAHGDVGTVVATIGTPGPGAVDPLPEILSLAKEYRFRVHADAAYGGYFVLAQNLSEKTKGTLALLGKTDSIAIDPHKHGLQPYGCGCVLFRDPRVGLFYKHDSPYTYFSSPELHLGEISLECSRPGAAAVALWATQKLLPLTRGGEFSRDLEKCRQAALALYHKLEQDGRLVPAFEPELDIVVFAPRAPSLSQVSDRSRRIFQAAARHDLHLALAELPATLWADKRLAEVRDRSTVTCLRSVLMKPEHLEWIEPIWERLLQAYNDTFSSA